VTEWNELASELTGMSKSFLKGKKFVDSVISEEHRSSMQGMCIVTCIRVYMYVCACVYIYFEFIYIFKYTYIYVQDWLLLECMVKFLGISSCIYIYIHICMYVYIYIYTYTY